MNGPVLLVASTGIGSLPGTDALEAARQIADNCEQLPYLPELPDRGPSAGMIGRMAAVLVDMPMELVHDGWQLSSRPSPQMRQAAHFLETDLEAAALVYQGAQTVKLQVCGPWTLAAALQLSNGHRVLTDRGAVGYLAESLAEGIAAQVKSLRAHMPTTTVVLQIDEPGLPAVLAGILPRASGVGTLAPVPHADVEALLGQLIGATGLPVVLHCCHRQAPLALLGRLGAQAVALDCQQVDPVWFEQVAQLLEGGTGLYAGLVPSTRPPQLPDPDALLRGLREVWAALGLSDGLLAAVSVTPACGLAGADITWAGQAMGLAARCGAALR